MPARMLRSLQDKEAAARKELEEAQAAARALGLGLGLMLGLGLGLTLTVRVTNPYPNSNPNSHSIIEQRPGVPQRWQSCRARLSEEQGRVKRGKVV